MDLADRQVLVDEVLAPNAGRAPPADLRAFSAEDRATVLDSYRRSCVSIVTADGSAIKVAWMDGCREALRARAPKDSNLPAACAIPEGGKDDGETCVADFQCASTRCEGASRSFGPICGKCEPKASAGDACRGSCGSGLECVGGGPVPGTHISSGSTCRPVGNKNPPPIDDSPAAFGEHCDTAKRCVDGLVCIYPAGTCGTPLPLGADCKSASQCERTATCSGGKCVARAPDGAACADDSDCLPESACGHGCDGTRTCTQRFDLGAPLLPPSAPTGDRFVCAIGIAERCTACPALAADGAPCENGIVCAPRSECVNGVCQTAALLACK